MGGVHTCVPAFQYTFMYFKLANMDIITLLYQRTDTQKDMPNVETRFHCP